jgi:hypothetical protein
MADTEVKIDKDLEFLQQEFDKNFIGSIEISLKHDYELLAQALAKEKNATDAYLFVHKGLRGSRKNISSRVSRLLACHPEIKARTAQIQLLAIRRVMSIDEALTILGNIARKEENNNPAVSRAAAKDIVDYYIKIKESKLNVNLGGSITANIADETISRLAEICRRFKADA